MSKYAQLIEFIINEQEDKARELFHSMVVEKSREIYESLIDEQDLSEVGGDEVESMVDEISSDEEGMEEAEDMDAGDEDSDEDFGSDDDEDDEDGEVDDMGDDDMGDDDMGDDDMGDDDMGDDDMGGDQPATKGDIMNIETALSDLQAKFDNLMADEMNEPEHADLGMDDMGDQFGDDMDDEGDEMAEMGSMSMPAMPTMEAKKVDKKADKKADAKKDSKKRMTESEWIREYVEKLGDIYSQDPAQAEGNEVGAGKKAKVSAKSIVAGKNDMGGSAKNLNQAGKGEDPDNKQTPEPSNEYTKGKGKLPGADKFKNAPGSKGDSFKSKAPTAKTGEQSGTNDKSPLAK